MLGCKSKPPAFNYTSLGAMFMYFCPLQQQMWGGCVHTHKHRERERLVKLPVIWELSGFTRRSVMSSAALSRECLSSCWALRSCVIGMSPLGRLSTSQLKQPGGGYGGLLKRQEGQKTPGDCESFNKKHLGLEQRQ